MAPEQDKGNCVVCGLPTTHLCDFVFGAQPKKDQPKFVDINKPLHTCDAQLCDKCRISKGHIHFHSGRQGCYESIDVCPIHEDAKNQSLVPISNEKAAEMRREVLAIYRRRNMYVPVSDVRYCRECGSIGEVPEGKRDCCPDGNHAVYLHPDIAEQARAGFLATIK